MSGNSVLCAALLAALGGAAAPAPAGKPYSKRLKAVSIDHAASRIAVREAGLEVIWTSETRFLVHRSVRRQELKRGAPIHVLGRLNSVRSTSQPVSDSLLTNVAFLGTGDAYEQPPLEPPGEFIRWHAGVVESVDRGLEIRIGATVHRVAVDDQKAVYSLQNVAPSALAGKSIVVRGTAETVEAGEGAKRRRVTRVLATEVHLLELDAEHAKVFELQWGDARKAPAGLRGEYFDATDFTSPKLSRVDPGVNFDWGTGAPHPAMEPEEFSVRWTGQVTAPATGTYTFHVITDDGVRLWVANQLLIDRWVGQGATEWTGTIALTAGKKYDIRMEYYDYIKTAVAKLLWTRPPGTKEVIPRSNLSPAPAPPAAAAAKVSRK